MSVMKDVKILTAPNTFETRDIGAEAQYIDVSLDSNGDIIEDITEPGVVVNTTESLTETLVGMKSDIDDKTELDMIGDAETIGGHPSRPYIEGEFLIGSDNNLYKVTEDIATTDDIEIDVNIESTTIAENLGKATDNNFNFVGTTAEWENLPSTDKAKYTSRDITDDYNGLPIDATPTQNSGNPVASGGVYTAVNEIAVNKQNNTLATARTIGGTSRTTVEAALGALTDANYLVDALNSSSKVKALTANQGLALANKHNVLKKWISNSDWVEDTTSQSGTTLYIKTITLNHIYITNPSVNIGPGQNLVLPTSAQQTDYNLLRYVTVDSATSKLYLYSTSVPTNGYYILIEGVD